MREHEIRKGGWEENAQRMFCFIENLEKRSVLMIRNENPLNFLEVRGPAVPQNWLDSP